MNSANCKKKILFVLPSLVSGGAEKVALQLLVNLNRDKYIPLVVLFENKGDFLKKLPEDIAVYDLKKNNRFSLPLLIHKLSSIIRVESPSLIVSYLIYSNFVALLSRTISFRKIPVIVAEHSVPFYSMKNKRVYWLKKYLYKYLYPKAERIITVSEGIKNELTTYWNISSEKIKVVHNAVELDRINILSSESIELQNNGNIPSIIAAGRLCEPKGYPYLLKAIKIVRENNPVQLLVLGDGEKKEELENLAKELTIFDSVTFLGFQKNPYKYIAKSTLFVLSSLWESFSIVIIEAMACGVPVISTRCPYGPEEIIADEINGLLVPVGNENVLAEAITRLLRDVDLRNRMISAGKKRAEDFGIERMVRGYERIFEEQIAD